MNSPFTQLGEQLGGIWKQLGLNQRVTLIFATGALIIGLVSLALWSSRVSYGLLYGKLDDAEAAKVVAVLNESKTPYRTGPNGSIMIPVDKVHAVRMQLASRGIPRGDGVGFEIFDKPNFGISDFVQRANYTRAVQGELARTIAQLDEVEAARVMVVMPENRLLTDNSRRPTASVFVKLRPHVQLSTSAVNSIRFLVANAVEGLQANFVSVVDNHGTVLSENNENDSVGGLSNTQLAARKNMENYLAKKAESLLEKVLGPGQAVVRVAAEINFDSLTRTEERYDPEGQVIRSSTITDENTDNSTSTAIGGVPGAGTNANADTNSAANPVNNSKTKKKVTNSQYEINKMTSNSILTAGGLKRVSAAVFVAAKTEGTGKDRKAVTRSDEELKKLRTIVRSALGIVENDPTRKDEITLEEMPFNDDYGMEQISQVQTQQKREFWMETGRQIAYGLIAAAALFVFWRGFKNAPAERVPLGVPVGQMAGEAGEEEGVEEVQPRKPEPLTVATLDRIVREHPENMTQAIRTWMARGNPSQN